MPVITDQVVSGGLPLVFAVAFAEQIGLPMPAIPVLVVAGALAADGRVDLLSALLLATAGGLLADLAWFAIGRRHGHRVLRTVCRISLSPDACVRRTEDLFERAGMQSLLVAKFLPGYSLVAPPLAGSMRASALAFTLWDLGGTGLWAGVAIGGGYLFHGAVDQALAALGGLGVWSIGVVGLAVALFILVRWYRRFTLDRLLRMARITAAELRALLLVGGEPLVLDVRGATQRRLDSRRIPGARAVPLEELAGTLASLPRDQEIILYCT
jgi:membrane protein DedA with SNARE-associated domain